MGPWIFFFQEDGVETETFAAVFQYVHFRKVHKTHQRIERFQPQELVVVVYCLHIQYFAHTFLLHSSKSTEIFRKAEPYPSPFGKIGIRFCEMGVPGSNLCMDGRSKAQ